MSTVSMFLRFYGSSASQISECLSELKPYLSGVEIQIEPLVQSMNPMIPPGKNTQVNLLFKSSKDLMAFQKLDEGRRIYRKYASPGRESEFSLRTPGQKSYKVAQ